MDILNSKVDSIEKDNFKDCQPRGLSMFNDSYLSTFLEQLDNKGGSLISTGFEGLDDLLGGGLYPGLYALGAVSSLGKTTFCLQIADQIASLGNDVIFFSLEQSKYELTSKSIVRYIHSNSNGGSDLNTMDFLKGSVQSDHSALNKGLEGYKLAAKNIAIRENEITTNNFLETITKSVKFRNKKPVIFVDYLQIVATEKNLKQHRNAIDYNVGEFKRISRRFDIPVVVISSFNRQSYKKSVSFEAFKESGKIEYSADVVIGLQLAQLREARLSGKKVSKEDINNWKGGDIREISLVLLKNRNGKSFGSIKYRFETEKNLFLEY